MLLGTEALRINSMERFEGEFPGDSQNEEQQEDESNQKIADFASDAATEVQRMNYEESEDQAEHTKFSKVDLPDSDEALEGVGFQSLFAMQRKAREEEENAQAREDQL